MVISEKIPTTELLNQLSSIEFDKDNHNHWDLVYALHRRPEEVVFQAAAHWCQGKQSKLRCLGADVLGQLGYEEKYPFAKESEPILMGMLSDSHPKVVSAALIAMGHLNIGVLSVICQLAQHESEEIRYAVAFCLGGRKDVIALQTLILLSADPVTEPRNWATFGLASLTEEDNPQLRDALFARLFDEHHEIQGEAICGLALRKDSRVIPVIMNLLTQNEISTLIFEAIVAFPQVCFLPELERVVEEFSIDEMIQTALVECRKLNS